MADEAEDTVKQTSAETGAAEEGSAPQNNNDQVTGNSTNQNRREAVPNNKGVDREFFKLREKGRQKDLTIEDLRSELAQFKGSRQESQADTGDAPQVDIQQELDKLKGALIQEFEGRETVKRIAAEENNADKWLSSRLYVQEDAVFADGVAGLIHGKYADIAKINPMVAAKQAYQDVCNLKGVVDATPDLSPARAGGGPGSSGPTGSVRKTDASNYSALRASADLNTPEGRAAAKKQLEALKRAEQ